MTNQINVRVGIKPRVVGSRWRFCSLRAACSRQPYHRRRKKMTRRADAVLLTIPLRIAP
ncbi:MAG: hypothetical protein ACREEM_43805 [Blastocatellia bacterium]